MIIKFDYKQATDKLTFICDDSDVFTQVREHFSVDNKGAVFARRRGMFVARRKYIITPTGTCDLGMYWDIRKYLIQMQVVADISICDSLQKVLDGSNDYALSENFNLSLRDYQKEVIVKALKIGRGVCVLGTGAGKTFITAALIESFFNNTNNKNTFKCLLIVPDLGLVTQTYNEFLNCGVTFKTTRWTGSITPDLTANVIICNTGIIQSRFSDNDFLKFVDVLIVDECHKTKAGNEITKIVSKIKTNNKFGFTGTLPEEQIDKWNIIGKFGPVIFEKSSYELRSENFLVNVQVKILDITYKCKPLRLTDNEYRDELSFIYDNKYRNEVIGTICKRLNNNTLVLVNHLAHGEAMFNYLSNISDRQVFYIRGEIEVEERERIKNLMEKHSNIICVAISAIFSTGVNIKNLHNIIFAAGGKSFVRTVQSIGRGLRQHESKTKLNIIDICDNLKYGKAHCNKRQDIYDAEKIEYSIKNIIQP